MNRYLIAALLAAFTACASAQSYEQRAAAERMEATLQQIDKANMDKARADAAATIAARPSEPSKGMSLKEWAFVAVLIGAIWGVISVSRRK